MINTIKPLFFTILSLVFLVNGCMSLNPIKGTSKSSSNSGPAAYSQALKNSKAFEGLFTVYQDTLSGKTHLEIREGQIDKEYIYFSQIADGVVDAGHFRGRFSENKVFRIRKYFDRIEFVAENTSFYFDDENPISRASSANISPSVMVSQKIKAHKKDKGVYLISSDEIFLNEDLDQVKPSPNPSVSSGRYFTLGKLDQDRTRYLDIRSFPKNTDVLVEYVYNNPAPIASGGSEVTDARNVGIQLQHSFLEMPDNDYKPRFEDPRVGYFTQQVEDMTSLSATPYRDMINRWNLQKKEPNARLSEPVEPIVWWIENTTPEEFREPIRQGVLAWNLAFEKAGFKNAIQVKIQPDTATWDANDIRYNVLRWTSSPRPPFAGYGPSFVNPRTGQILGANVMLEYMFIRRNLVDSELFETAGLDMPPYEYRHSPEDGAICTFGYGMQHNMMTGISVARGMDLAEVAEDRLLNEALKMLALHEVGHTLGLNHNMKASILHSPEDIYHRENTEKVGLTASVMDYGVINLSPDKYVESQFFDTKPGIYDNWAIEYGYSAPDNAEEEQVHLESILSRSTQRGHDFGNDADDMRSPGKAIDPRVMTWDMSSDAITYSIDRIELLRETMWTIKDRYTTEGKSYQELRNVYLVLSSQHNMMAGVITRYIGGVYVDRSLPGQDSDMKPFTPVSKKDQKRAIEALNKYVFAADAFDTPASLYNYLQMQRRGFDFFSKTEDPKIHDRALNIQKNTLNHILHPVVMKRMSDSQHYGNEYPLAEFMQDLKAGIFQADINGHVNSFRQNLQQEYVNRLINISGEDSKHDYLSKSLALHTLIEIQEDLENRPDSDVDTIAHTRHLLRTIEKTLEI
ncbi:MAG: zinc-dependent metalloprotease [Balneolales bacterium]